MRQRNFNAVTLFVAVIITLFSITDADYPSEEEFAKYCREDSGDAYSYKEYEVGWLKEGSKEHTIKGRVTILDKYRFKIHNFTYDGEAPSTYVLAMKKGTTGFYPSGGYTLYVSGIDETGKIKYTCINLADPAYRFGNLSLTVSLPAGVDETVTTKDIRAISIFSYEFCINFRSREIAVIPDSNWNAVKGEYTPYCEVKSAGRTDNRKLVSEIKELCDEKQTGGFPTDICSGASLTIPFRNLVVFLSIQFLCFLLNSV